MTVNVTYRTTDITDNILVIFYAETIDCTNGLLQVRVTLLLHCLHYQFHRWFGHLIFTFNGSNSRNISNDRTMVHCGLSTIPIMFGTPCCNTLVHAMNEYMNEWMNDWIPITCSVSIKRRQQAPKSGFYFLAQMTIKYNFTGSNQNFFEYSQNNKFPKYVLINMLTAAGHRLYLVILRVCLVCLQNWWYCVGVYNCTTASTCIRKKVRKLIYSSLRAEVSVKQLPKVCIIIQ